MAVGDLQEEMMVKTNFQTAGGRLSLMFFLLSFSVENFSNLCFFVFERCLLLSGALFRSTLNI